MTVQEEASPERQLMFKAIRWEPLLRCSPEDVRSTQRGEAKGAPGNLSGFLEYKVHAVVANCCLFWSWRTGYNWP